MKINKEFILKNLTAIFSVIAVVAMFLPFIAVEASVSVGGFGGNTGATTYNGFVLVTAGGILGILLELCLLVIIASSYIPQIAQYRKFVLLGASVVSLLCIIIVPGMIAGALSQAGGAGASAGSFKTEVDVKFSLLIGYWIMLIADIIIIAMSVIQFFGLKGNKVFDLVNNASPTETTGEVSLPKFDVEKLKSMTQSVAGNISNVADNIKNKASSDNVAANSGTAGVNATAENNAGVNTSAPVRRKYSQNISRDEIMSLIKELHGMKEAGILTEEEFSTKKQEYLEML